MKIVNYPSRCRTISQIRLRMLCETHPIQYISVVRSSGIVVFLGQVHQKSDEEIFVASYHSRPMSETTYSQLVEFAKSTKLCKHV